MNKKIKIGDVIKVKFEMTVKDGENKPAVVGRYKDTITVIVYNERIASHNVKNTIIDIIGNEIPVKIIDYLEKDNLIIGDIMEIKERELKELLEKLDNGETVSAKIVKLLSYGAFLDCNGVSGYLKNINFSDNYVAISDVHKVGDLLDVKLLRKSEKGNYSFEMVEKYHGEDADITEFHVDDIRTGKVISARPFGTFVRLGTNLDCICPPLKSLVVEEGDKVVVQIAEVIEEERRIRALIKKIIADN